jgi:hypothetical protein
MTKPPLRYTYRKIEKINKDEADTINAIQSEIVGDSSMKEDLGKLLNKTLKETYVRSLLNSFSKFSKPYPSAASNRLYHLLNKDRKELKESKKISLRWLPTSQPSPSKRVNAKKIEPPQSITSLHLLNESSSVNLTKMDYWQVMRAIYIDLKQDGYHNSPPEWDPEIEYMEVWVI